MRRWSRFRRNATGFSGRRRQKFEGINYTSFLAKFTIAIYNFLLKNSFAIRKDVEQGSQPGVRDSHSDFFVASLYCHAQFILC